MNGFLAVVLTLVAIAGGLTVMIGEPVRQAIMAGVLGLLLAVLFYAVQAPDVALSELVVAGAGIPVMLLLAIAKIRAQESHTENAHEEEDA